HRSCRAPPKSRRLFIESEMEVLGVPSTADLSHPKKDADPGREKIIPMPEYFGAFKTPGIRNSGLTAPYMHNGVFATLEEVVEFYNKGGGVGIGLDIPNQTLESTPLQLDSIEKQNLISFLNSLNDTVNSTSTPDVLPAFDLSKKFSPRKVGGDY
ncbi:MAG TPA: cytochrome C peroxidase, partial [Bacteroidia bacterium]|nr:cytochrome C peroxidase [Bacteroidia bacterium]